MFVSLGLVNLMNLRDRCSKVLAAMVSTGLISQREAEEIGEKIDVAPGIQEEVSTLSCSNAETLGRASEMLENWNKRIRRIEPKDSKELVESARVLRRELYRSWISGHPSVGAFLGLHEFELETAFLYFSALDGDDSRLSFEVAIVLLKQCRLIAPQQITGFLDAMNISLDELNIARKKFQKAIDSGRLPDADLSLPSYSTKES